MKKHSCIECNCTHIAAFLQESLKLNDSIKEVKSRATHSFEYLIFDLNLFLTNVK